MRTAWAAAITGGIASMAVGVRWGAPAGLGFLTGLAWGLANGWALAELLRSVVTPLRRDVGKALAMGVVKLALYAGGIVLLWKAWLPPAALGAGFTWLFVVVVLRAIGALRAPDGAGDPGTRER